MLLEDLSLLPHKSNHKKQESLYSINTEEGTTQKKEMSKAAH